MSIAGRCIIGNPPAGGGGVQSVNGDTGPNVVLDAADVGAATPAQLDSEQQRAETAEQANEQAIAALSDKVYTTIELSRKGNVDDNNFLRFGEIETKDGQGPSWSNSYSIKKIEWSQKESDVDSGAIVFYADGVSIGTVSVTANKTGEIPSPEITIPANQQIGFQWQGPRIKELSLNIQGEQI